MACYNARGGGGAAFLIGAGVTPILFTRAQPPHLRDQRRVQEGQLDAIPDVLGPLVQDLDQARLVAGALDRERGAELRHGAGDRRLNKFSTVSTSNFWFSGSVSRLTLPRSGHRSRSTRSMPIFIVVVDDGQLPAGALQSEDHVLRVWFHFHHGHVAAVRDEVGPHLFRTSSTDAGVNSSSPKDAAASLAASALFSPASKGLTTGSARSGSGRGGAGATQAVVAWARSSPATVVRRRFGAIVALRLTQAAPALRPALQLLKPRVSRTALARTTARAAAPFACTSPDHKSFISPALPIDSRRASCAKCALLACSHW